MYWYLKVLKQYADFEGRARRKEYWMFVLIHSFIILSLELINLFIYNDDNFLLDILLVIYCLALTIRLIAVTVRRLHDIDKSGFWYFIYFIPIIGSIWLFILTIEESCSGKNPYGPNPVYEDKEL